VDGSTENVTGVLTTRVGALESGRKAFLQDDTAGIACISTSRLRMDSRQAADKRLRHGR